MTHNYSADQILHNLHQRMYAVVFPEPIADGQKIPSDPLEQG